MRRHGLVPGRPLFVLPTAFRPRSQTSVPYTFVTDGIESAITQAKAVADDKYVALAGSQATQQCLRAGLLDEIQVDLVSLLLGGGVRLFATSADRSAWKSSACSMLQA